ncbi:unnamed protein product [Bemisia tabaci]|uniref:Thioredoxin domain-containing protein n=1 Tax=Bemisia tabaci TaxID=7038 RepID=A0A9P0AM81_BEMTA|nr:PREDICTED: glutaredoxin-3 [Bemisia tabaci]CAH0394332.1 unnamed protein product [Bemisia tabaci]
MTLLSIQKSDEFETLIQSPELVTIHFYADWSDQCKHMDSVFSELSKQADFKGVKFAKIAAEDFPDLSMKYNVAAVPTFVFFKSGQDIDRVDGANAPQLTAKIKSLISAKPTVTSGANHVGEGEDINDRLKRLINSAPVILFMKGTPDTPKCGFSNQIVSILREVNCNFASFDILNDNAVREGLKKFSNWPTYPQLYVDGNLIGGLDIIKEMKESGELEELVKSKSGPSSNGTSSLNERLKALINQANVMVFMKGNPENPRCGFSRQLMEILKETGVKFETFDILNDNSVREGLKIYSSWPTYPQVYVKGSLIGGLDIIKELKEAGELVSSLTSS